MSLSTSARFEYLLILLNSVCVVVFFVLAPIDIDALLEDEKNEYIKCSARS